MADFDNYLSVEDIAARLDMHTESVRRKMRNGGFPGAIKPKGEWILSPEDYDSYVKNSGRRVLS